MTKAKLIKMQNFAQENNLRFDANAGAIFGKCKDYDICISESSQGAIIVSTSLAGVEGPVTKKDIKSIKKEVKGITYITVKEGGEVHFTIGLNFGLGGGYAKMGDKLLQITDYLKLNGYKNICIMCEQNKPLSTYHVNGVGANFCDECYTNLTGNLKAQEHSVQQKDENTVFGIVGALLGSILGVAAIVLIGQLGYVAAISGLILGVCTLKGYEKFAGKLSKIGVSISIIIMVIMVILGNRLDWAVAIVRETGENLLDTFIVLPEIIEYVELQSEYNRNLIMIGVFALGGSYKSIINAFKNPTGKAIVKKLEG